jgi:hypothetical protein
VPPMSPEPLPSTPPQSFLPSRIPGASAAFDAAGPPLRRERARSRSVNSSTFQAP